jgi:hypothetical protein
MDHLKDMLVLLTAAILVVIAGKIGVLSADTTSTLLTGIVGGVLTLTRTGASVGPVTTNAGGTTNVTSPDPPKD